MLSLLSKAGGDISGLARADEVKRPQVREKANAAPLAPLCAPPERPETPPVLDEIAAEARRVLPRGRNFH
jgi:hypothetical protein